MPSIKSFLSDHETALDLLNNEAIAKTIVSLLRERPERPVTIGVHGDWGAGKSSILEMIEASLKDDKDVLCLKFNGWQFQGFEDAKIALIEGIVAGLVEKRPTLTRAKEKLLEVTRRIDVMKVAKKGGALALSAYGALHGHDAATTMAAMTGAIAVLSDPEKLKDKAKDAAEGLKDVIKDKPESKSVPKELGEFRKAFEDLLEEAGIKQLVVLVDDLDRCLPGTAIETLEAIRLFVFTPKTAFVVAADEAMIEYSVREHFPDLPSSSGPQSYARNYLEKLIQVPFRIPSLGEGETRVYVALALAEATLGTDSAEFKALLAHAREVLTKPWLGGSLGDAEVAAALGAKGEEAAELLLLSDRIGPALARGTSGNPRQIKRFLNAMLLRERTATARGFGDDIQTPALAKIMLAERFKDKFFDDIILEAAADPNGRSKSLASLETPPADEVATAIGGVAKAGTGKAPVKEAERSRWADDAWVTDWTAIPPALSGLDLRPYAFIANQQARLTLGTRLGPLLPLLNALMGKKMAVVAAEGQLGALAPASVDALMQELCSRVRSSDLSREPDGVEGLRSLVKTQPRLQTALVDFLERLPVEELGAWVVRGWASSIKDEREKERLEALVGSWSTQTANGPLAAIAKQGGGKA